jgi:uncharacterized protein
VLSPFVTTVQPLKFAAFGLVLLAVLALPAAAATPDARTITVIGNGEAEPESLPGAWTLVVSAENERAGIALRTARAAVARTEAALRASGPAEVRVGRMSLNAQQAPEPSGALRGFVASTQIELTVPDVQRAATLLDRVRLAGVRQVYGPVASDQTSKELTRRALADGFDDAVEKARQLAAKAGVTLGAVLTIEERLNQPTFPAIVYGPGGPLPRFPAPSEDVYANVTVTFAVS